MSAFFYNTCRVLCAIPRAACIRETLLHADRARRPGPFILACTHISHLEPLFISAALPRQVRWMSRIEFYRTFLARFFLNHGGAFCVDRYGYSAPAIRTAIRLLRQGEIVGMFPEGGVVEGPDSVLRRAPIKQGVATIAIAAQVPIIPVIVLGTQHLNAIRPWLPTKSGRVTIAFGDPVTPPRREPHQPRRPLRAALSAQLVNALATLGHEALTATNLTLADIP